MIDAVDMELPVDVIDSTGINLVGGLVYANVGFFVGLAVGTGGTRVGAFVFALSYCEGCLGENENFDVITFIIRFYKCQLL